MHPIAVLIASYLSTASRQKECVRAMDVAQRAINRLPDEDTARMPGICDAYNIAHMQSAAMTARLVDGDINYAMRCESAANRLLEKFGL